jgi:hypothetical protein
MKIEILDKTTGKVTEISLRGYIETRVELGPKGKLNEVLNLTDGAVEQNPRYAFRIKGIKHTWEW